MRDGSKESRLTEDNGGIANSGNLSSKKCCRAGASLPEPGRQQQLF